MITNEYLKQHLCDTVPVILWFLEQRKNIVQVETSGCRERQQARKAGGKNTR